MLPGNGQVLIVLTAGKNFFYFTGVCNIGSGERTGKLLFLEVFFIINCESLDLHLKILGQDLKTKFKHRQLVRHLHNLAQFKSDLVGLARFKQCIGFKFNGFVICPIGFPVNGRFKFE